MAAVWWCCNERKISTYLVKYAQRFGWNVQALISKHTAPPPPLLLANANIRFNTICIPNMYYNTHSIQQPVLLPYISGAQICRKSSVHVYIAHWDEAYDTFSQPKRILWIKTELLTLHFIQSVIECGHRHITSLSYSRLVFG